MFELSKTKMVETDFPLIAENYHTLHFDEEPILFYGTNRYGNKIIGSLVDEDYKNKIILFFHVIIDSRSFFDFMNQKITYLDILKNSNLLYVVEKDFEEKLRNIFLINFKDIPVQYIPLENSFCPKQELKYGLDFILNLKGRLANMNFALPAELSNIQNSFSNFLETTLKDIPGFKLKPKIYQSAYTGGSFKLNFSIECINELDLFINNEDISKLINLILNYSINNLHSEVDVVFDTGIQGSKLLDNIKTKIIELYGTSHTKVPEDIDQFIKNEIIKTANTLQHISENIGYNFSEIELFNKIRTIENPIGLIDYSFKNLIQSTVDAIESKIGEIYIDTEPQNYKISIYHLNTDSRTGNALIYNFDSDIEMSRPRIKISGELPLEKTKYTESLYLNKWITVKSIAKRVDEKYRELNIIFEE
jgi:hypothetical protein